MQIPTHYPYIFHFDSEYSACIYFDNKNLSSLCKYQNYLCEAEQDFFKSLKHQNRQLSYLLGRYCAKQALKGYTHHSNLTDWYIKPGIFNQPIIIHNPTALNLGLSIAHTATYGSALVFPMTHPMAIDLELINPRKQAVIQTYCSLHERKIPVPADDLTKYFLLWTAKEALAKVLKTGLGTSFKFYEVAQVKDHGKYYESQYVYFSQYKCISWIHEEILISMLKPSVE